MQLEVDIEQSCRKLAEANECLLIKIKSIKGWPDRMLLAPNGRIMFLELKRPGRDADPFQKNILEGLRAMNFPAEVVTNTTDFQEYMVRLKKL